MPRANPGLWDAIPLGLGEAGTEDEGVGGPWCDGRGAGMYPYCGGLFGRGWQAHSVRGESCNTDSSPEPSAACSEGGNPVRGSVLLCWEPGVPRVARGTPGWYGCGFCQVGAGVLFHVRHDFSGSQVVGESDGRTGMITHHDCGDMLEFACWLTHWLLSSWPDPLSIDRAFVSSRSLIS